MNNIRSTFSSLREYLTPVTHTSTFKTTGEITPEEFVAAGDYLAYKFPTWEWSPVHDKSLEKPFLPPDKQFLVTRKVPSYQRALSYLSGGAIGDDDEEEVVGEDGWTTTHVSRNKAKNVIEESNNKEPSSNQEEFLNDQEIEDIDDDDFEVASIDKSHSANQTIGNNDVNNRQDKRSYDLYISYSTSYRVPKMYLVGFDSDGIPLTPDQMFEDISADYRDKTATIEKAPFLKNTTSVSIHPCRHATVMKILMNRAQIAAHNKKLKESKTKNFDISEGISKLGLKDNETTEDEDWENVNEGHTQEDEEIIKVDHYLVIFLKFIASVTPGIYHDYTMDAF